MIASILEQKMLAWEREGEHGERLFSVDELKEEH
jgi:hypothetical protein